MAFHMAVTLKKFLIAETINMLYALMHIYKLSYIALRVGSVARIPFS